jgi:hypothetical protein
MLNSVQHLSTSINSSIFILLCVPQNIFHPVIANPFPEGEAISLLLSTLLFLFYCPPLKIFFPLPIMLAFSVLSRAPVNQTA